MNFACGKHCRFMVISLRGETFARVRACAPHWCRTTPRFHVAAPVVCSGARGFQSLLVSPTMYCYKRLHVSIFRKAPCEELSFSNCSEVILSSGLHASLTMLGARCYTLYVTHRRAGAARWECRPFRLKGIGGDR